MTTIRPQVVAVLARLDSFDPDLHPDLWTIDGGQPLTDQERRLALSGTIGEVRAALDLMQASLETVAAEADAGQRLLALLEPFWSDPDQTITQVIATMPVKERAEAEELLRGMPKWLEMRRG